MVNYYYSVVSGHCFKSLGIKERCIHQGDNSKSCCSHCWWVTTIRPLGSPAGPSCPGQPVTIQSLPDTRVYQQWSSYSWGWFRRTWLQMLSLALRQLQVAVLAHLALFLKNTCSLSLPFVKFIVQRFCRRGRSHFSLSADRCAYHQFLHLACNFSSFHCFIEFYLCLFTFVHSPRSDC